MTIDEVDSQADLDGETSELAKTGRVLAIGIKHPTAIYVDVLNLLETKDMLKRLSGETIGIVEPPGGHPIRKIKSSVIGTRTYENWEPVPNNPGVSRGVGETVDKFGFNTEFTLEEGMYVNPAVAQAIVNAVKNEGYLSEIVLDDVGRQRVSVTGTKWDFEINLLFPDKTTELRWRVSEAERLRGEYLDLLPMWERTIEEVRGGKKPGMVTLQVKGDPPNVVPAARKIESKDQVMSHLSGLRDLTEVVATVLTKELREGKELPGIEMTWESKAPYAVWNEAEKVAKPEDLESMSVDEINSSLIRVVQGLDMGKDCPDLINGEGIDANADKLLRYIEDYFTDEIDEHVFNTLGSRQKSLLALGLALKSAKEATVYGPKFFIPGSNPQIAGVTFNMYGESGRNRFEFFMQQNRKFGYNTLNAEAAEFFLLHTTFKNQKDRLTRYEKIQSENIVKARRHFTEDLEVRKKGRYEAADVLNVNSMLLENLVPARFLGRFRHTEQSYIEGRIGNTEASEVKANLGYLFGDAGKYVLEITEGKSGVDEDEVLKRLVRFWVCYDSIHPSEEGNGRTGMLFFESWLRLALGSERRFVSERSENQTFAKLMSQAQVGDSDSSFWYLGQQRFIKDVNLDPLVDYVKSHMIMQAV